MLHQLHNVRMSRCLVAASRLPPAPHSASSRARASPTAAAARAPPQTLSISNWPQLLRRHICVVAAAGSNPQVRPAGARPSGAQTHRGSASGKAVPAAPRDETWLIVGLGNPGPRYQNTRHNVGFLVIDSMARAASIDMRKLEKSAAVGRGELHGRKIILAKPVTFMNNSGESVSALARFYKIPQQRVLVISDDLDQPTAAVRLRMKGGHGGHNGLRSIMQHFGGSQDFPRLKIGIGRPEGQMDVASYVLQEFRRSEMEAISQAIDESIRVVESCLALGLEKAASGSRL